MHRVIGTPLAETDLIAQHNRTFFLNVVDSANWQTVFDGAKNIYNRDYDRIRRDEGIFLKHFWLQDYLLNHPFAPENAEPYIERMKLGVE
jgi:Holliday junction resolvase-like predicted endonuclease